MANLRHKLVFLVAITLCQTSFADTLKGIFELAFENDAQLRAARAQLRADSETEKRARGQLLPQINAQYSMTDSDTESSGEGGLDGVLDKDTSTEDDTWSIQLQQSLFDLNKWFTFKSGQAVTDRAKVLFASAAQDLIVRVVSAYFDVLSAQDNLTSSRAEEKAIQRQLEQTQQRFDVGLIAITDVHEARAAFDISRVARLNDEGLLGITMEALSVITGQAHSDLARLSEDFPIKQPDPLTAEEWVDLAMTNNYDIAASLHALESARMTAKASKASHYPTISASFSYADSEKGDIDPAGPFYESSETEQLSFDLTLPLFSGGSVSAARRQAYEQYNVAKENHTGILRTAIQAIRSFHLAVRTDIARVNARQQSITSSQSALDATEAGYEVGTRNVVDVLQSQRALFAARRDYANARYAYVVNMMKLMQQAGLLQPENVLTLNKWLPES
jgi:outer membrane protein